jgi:hypothetical protein
LVSTLKDKIMKRSLVLIFLLPSMLFVRLAFSQFRIQASVPADQLSCAGNKVDYEVIFDAGFRGCSYSWRIKSGRGHIFLHSERKEFGVTWPDQHPNRVSVEVTVRYIATGGDCRSASAIWAEPVSFTTILKTVFFTAITGGTTQAFSPYCTTDAVRIFVDPLKIANTGGAGQPPETFSDTYQWRLPAGFRRVGTNQEGTFTTTENELFVYPPNTCASGNVIVRAMTTCIGQEPTFSNAFSINIARSPQFSLKAQPGYTGPSCGVTEPVTFTATAYSCATGYHWSFPSGWTGPTFTTGNVNILTPSGGVNDGIAGGNDGKIKVSTTVGPCPALTAEVNSFFRVPNLSIAGPDPLCSTASYVLEGLAGNASVNWSVTPSGIVSPVSGTGLSATLSRISNGNVTLQYNIPSCQASAGRSFKVGPYSSSDYPIQGPDHAGCGQDVYYSIPDLPGATSINWTWPAAWTYLNGQGTRYLALRTGSHSGTVAVGVNNPCGISGSYATKHTSVSGCFFQFTASPNPVDAELTITYNETSEQRQAAGYRDHFENEIEVALIDNKQTKKHSVRTTKKKLTISTKEIERGMYILHIVTREHEEKHQIVVSH